MSAKKGGEGKRYHLAEKPAFGVTDRGEGEVSMQNNRGTAEGGSSRPAGKKCPAEGKLWGEIHWGDLKPSPSS